MCAKTRKLKTRRTKEPKDSLLTIILVLVIISIIAAAIAYFFYDFGKTKSNIPAKAPTGSTKTISENKSTPTKSILDGTWVSSTDGRMLEIHGTVFSMELPSVSEHKITKGQIYIKGNIVTIIYSGTKDKCAENPGTYSFVVNKGSILFIAKHDNCPGRKQVFSTTWEKF